MATNELRTTVARAPRTFSHAELLNHVSQDGLASLVRDGTLVRLLPDTYAGSLHASSWMIRAQAACIWGGPDSLVTGSPALLAHGVNVGEPSFAHLWLPWGSHRRPPRWLRIRTTVAQQVGVLWRESLPLIGPASALIHAHEAAPDRDRATLVYRTLASGVTTVEEVAGALERMPRVRGRESLQRRLILAAGGAESFLEERAHVDILRGDRLGSLIRQHRVRVGGKGYRVDAFDLRTATAVEFDGAENHDKPADRRRDVNRDALLAQLGILTVRLTFVDVMTRPGWCRRTLLAILKAREADGGAGLSAP